MRKPYTKPSVQAVGGLSEITRGPGSGITWDGFFDFRPSGGGGGGS